MEINLTCEQLAERLAECLRIEVEIENDFFKFTFTKYGSKRVIEATRSEFSEVISSLSSFEIVDELCLYSKNTYHVLVREESHFPRFRNGRTSEPLVIEDDDAQCVYKLTKPSDVYVAFLIECVFPLTSGRGFAPMPPRMIAERILNESDDDVSIFTIASQIALRFNILEISSVKDKTKNDFLNLSNSFLFQISFNLDAALVQQRHIEEIIRTARITRFRRSEISEIDPPRRKYIPDLIYHYQLGVGSDNPFLEFISYYHIAEHFFESIFNDDLIEKIKTNITKPDFSYRRKKDVSDLIKTISKSLQIRNESISFSEISALVLTLEKFVDFSSVKDKLDDYDSDLVDFYRTTRVEFSGGSLVNFNLDSPDLKNLANRIYMTRNAIVHSKDSDKSKYIPFKHDRILIKEIPLLRFIAEEIIINSSELMQ